MTARPERARGWARLAVLALSLVAAPAFAGDLVEPYSDLQFCGDFRVDLHLDPTAFAALTSKDCFSLCSKVASDCKAIGAKIASCRIATFSSRHAAQLRNCGEFKRDAAKACKSTVDDEFQVLKLTVTDQKKSAADACVAFRTTCQSNCLPP
jgi:hypothetical protein